MPTPTRSASVIVVGGGVTGLLMARRLAGAGTRVTLLERGPRLGGQIHTIELGGMKVDVGAESVHLGLPAMKALVEELALDSTVTGSRPGTSWLWLGKRRRPLPAGVGPAGPTKIWPVLTSRVLGLPALVRAGLEPLYARKRGPIDLSPGHDISVGEFVTGRFGRGVTDAFVDPLLGSLHSGDIHRLSLRATSPALVPAARDGRSLLLRKKPAPAKAPNAAPAMPMFASWPGGLGTLTAALLDGTDVDVRLGAHATALTRNAPVTTTGNPGDDAPTYTVTLADGQTLTADAVVITTPAAAAADLLRPAAPSAAATLAQIETANTATIVMAFRRADVKHLPALNSNGFLVPSKHGSLLKAGTHLDRKWEHLDDGEHTLYRLSVGRAGNPLLASLDDDALVDHVRRDLRALTGIEAAPTLVHVHRWTSGLPQLTVGHTDRIAAVRDEVATALPGVVLAGASYDGVGIGACVTSAEKAAARLLDRLENLDRLPQHP